MKARYEGWGWDINLEIIWTHREHGVGEEGPWDLYKALLWQRNPMQILASIVIRNMEYVIHTQGLFGMTKEQQEALEKHLNGMGMKKRESHVGL